jgi:phosphomannomutase
MIKFGTDGWRAVIGEEFTFENVAKVAQAYADLLSSPPAPLPVGFDRRFLSEEFAKTVASVLAANGLKVALSQGYCPTPCISWMTKATKAPGGVMITASHNPFEWNGVKFKESYGGSASPLLTSQVEKRIEKNESEGRQPLKIPFEEGVSQKKIVRFDPAKEYVAQLRSQIDLGKIQKASWRIAYDPLFGAGAGFLQKVLEMPVSEIHGEWNPGFGGLNPEPIEKNLLPFLEFVKKEKFDVGLATDGDADRIGAVDEKGQFVNPHQIFALILKHLIERGERGDVIKTVSTTQMVDRIAKKQGLTVHETPIGFKHICTKFLEVKPLAGGEESGGIGIPSHVYERDGLLSGLLLLEIMSVKKKRLGELLKELSQEIGPFSFEREDIHLEPEASEKLRNDLGRMEISRIGALKVVRINRLDGLKFLLEDESWLLIRLSGTEPLVRLYAEASDPKRVKNLIQEGRRLLNLS